jgi:translation initiation factor 3 subunit G
MQTSSTEPSSKLKWGDEEFEQEVDHQTEPDENGIKYVYEYHTNEDGKRVRVTKKVRVYKNVKTVSHRVEERRKRWKKFGKCVGQSEVGITYVGEEVQLVLGEEERKERERIEREKKDKQELESMYTSMIAEGKKPGGPIQAAGPTASPGGTGGPAAPAAWRPSWKTGAGSGAPPSSSSVTTPPPTEAGGSVYVPPHKKGGGSSTGGPADSTSTDYTTTIRVTNLSEETTENDLQDMFRKFGPISRIYLVRDKLTNTSRGFAFITYNSRKDAETAMEEMDGKGWDYLILSIEWAKPSK